MTNARDILVQTLAETLGERKVTPIAQIRRIVERLGAKRTIELAQDALAMQKAGGVLIPNGTRKRTTGGIFFLLCKGHLTPEDRRYVFPKITKAPDDKSEASAQSFEKNGTMGGNTTIVPQRCQAV